MSVTRAASDLSSPPHGPVLIVDDDGDLRSLMAELLEQKGYDVRTAADGQEALDLLTSGPTPCIIILDLMMPVMDGWEFRARQRALPDVSDVPVVILSGVHDIARQTKELAALDGLPKPLDLGRLQRSLELHC